MPFSDEQSAVQALRDADRDFGILTVERLCNEALEQFTDSAVLWAFRADCLLSRGNVEDSREAICTALGIDPDCPFAHAVKMRHHLFMAEDPEADREADWLNRQPLLDIESRLFLGDYYMTIGDKRARSQVDAVLRDYPDDFEALGRLIYVLTFESEYELASRALRQFQQLFPQNGLTFVKMGREAARLKDLVECERLYRIGLDLMPEMGAGWSELSVRLTFVGKWEEAAEYAEKALAINSRSALALRTLSMVAEQNGNSELANQYRERANKAVPREAHVNAMNDANALTKLGRYQEAIVEINKAIESNVKHTRIHALYIKVGIMKRARDWVGLHLTIDQLDKEGDRSAIFYQGKVGVCLAKKLFKEAQGWFNDGLKQFPNSGELRSQQIRFAFSRLSTRERALSLKEAAMADYLAPSDAILVIRAMLDVYQVETAMLLLRRARETFPDRPDWDKMEKTAKWRWSVRNESIFAVPKNLKPMAKAKAILARTLLKTALVLQYGPPRRRK